MYISVYIYNIYIHIYVYTAYTAHIFLFVYLQVEPLEGTTKEEFKLVMHKIMQAVLLTNSQLYRDLPYGALVLRIQHNLQQTPQLIHTE